MSRELQYQNSTGRWMDAGDRAEEFVACAERFVASCQTDEQRSRLLHGHATVRGALEAGRTAPKGCDWYDNIRYRPEPRSAAQVEMVKCACGHTVPRSSVMSASLGTSCPDCYDRMSD